MRLSDIQQCCYTAYPLPVTMVLLPLDGHLSWWSQSSAPDCRLSIHGSLSVKSHLKKTCCLDIHYCSNCTDIACEMYRSRQKERLSSGAPDETSTPTTLLLFIRP
ncbi:hypothetical protein GJ744_008948 [Endocarpon pusillum]|uniref:Uncharacterized protein n=1 Tax=Endocarpon pusillum TaxID=364733 RepID=A0A8H7AKI5_9EURO|nr:hypothetical protein GJ744_008948 [Endocarpon pusillum]